MHPSRFAAFCLLSAHALFGCGGADSAPNSAADQSADRLIVTPPITPPTLCALPALTVDHCLDQSWVAGQIAQLTPRHHP